MNKWHIRLAAWSLGIVYLWFGMLKLFPETSPAENLVVDTVNALFLGAIPASTGLMLVGIGEVLISVLLFSGWKLRGVAVLVFVHLAFTFTPFVLLSEQCFSNTMTFTLVGQYIMKNVVLGMVALLLFYYSKSSD